MHDGITLEKRGVPTAAMVTDAFIGNAKNMARLAGIPEYPFIVLPHPVSSLDEKEIDALVRRFLPQVLERLVSAPKR